MGSNPTKKRAQMFFKRSVFGICVLMGIVTRSPQAFADNCPYVAIADQALAAARQLNTRLEKGDCSVVDQIIAKMREQNEAVRNAVSKCPGHELTKTGSGDFEGARAALMKSCTAASKKSSPTTSDPSPGQVGNAAGCIDVVKEGATLYHFNNTCTYAVTFVFTSRGVNRELEADDTSISAQSSNTGNAVISYFSYRPTIIWGCAMKSPGCSDAAAIAVKKSFNSAQAK